VHAVVDCRSRTTAKTVQSIGDSLAKTGCRAATRGSKGAKGLRERALLAVHQRNGSADDDVPSTARRPTFRTEQTLPCASVVIGAIRSLARFE
jgi:hypothetical protein